MDKAEQQIAAGYGKEQAEQDHGAEQGVGKGTGVEFRLPEVLGYPEQLQQQLQTEQQYGKAQYPIEGGQTLITPELPDQYRELQGEHGGEDHDPAVDVRQGAQAGG